MAIVDDFTNFKNYNLKNIQREKFPEELPKRSTIRNQANKSNQLAEQASVRRALMIQAFSATFQVSQDPVIRHIEIDNFSHTDTDHGFTATSTPKRPKIKQESDDDSGIIEKIFVSFEEEESFEVVPKEISNIEDTNIVTIMQNLSNKDRLNFAAAGKRFNDLLTNSPNDLPMDPLTLNFSKSMNEFPARFTRTYRKLEVSELHMPLANTHGARILEIFNSLRGHVVDLKFISTDMTLQFFNRIIGTMPNLETIALGCSTSNLQLNEEFEPLPLLKLRKITTNARNVEAIAKIIRNVTTLEEFVFRAHDEHAHLGFGDDTDDEDEPYDDTDDEDEEPGQQEPDQEDDEADIEIEEVEARNLFMFNALFAPGRPHVHGGFIIELLQPDDQIDYTDIKEILARQVNLKRLEINEGHFFETEFQDVQFKLKELTFFIKWASRSQLQNMARFLEKQDEIESLTVNILCGSHIVEMNRILSIVMRIPTLKDLKLIFYESTGVIEAYRDLNSFNPNVQELYLGMGGLNRHVSTRLLMEATHRHFPNLRKLHMILDSFWRISNDDTALEPLSQLTHLEALAIENVNVRVLANVRIPTLRKVVLKNIRRSPLERWPRFFLQNPGIRELYFHFRNQEYPEVVDFVRSIELFLQNITKVKN